METSLDFLFSIMPSWSLITTLSPNNSWQVRNTSRTKRATKTWWTFLEEGVKRWVDQQFVTFLQNAQGEELNLTALKHNCGSSHSFKMKIEPELHLQFLLENGLSNVPDDENEPYQRLKRATKLIPYGQEDVTLTPAHRYTLQYLPYPPLPLSDWSGMVCWPTLTTSTGTEKGSF